MEDILARMTATLAAGVRSRAQTVAAHSNGQNVVQQVESNLAQARREHAKGQPAPNPAPRHGRQAQLDLGRRRVIPEGQVELTGTDSAQGSRSWELGLTTDSLTKLVQKHDPIMGIN